MCIQTWLPKRIRYFRPCDVWQFRQLSIGFTAYGTSWRPKRCSCFFFFTMQCSRRHVTAKSGIPDQTHGIHTLLQNKRAKFKPLFQTRNAWKWYPLGRHITIWLIYGVPPPRGFVHNGRKGRNTNLRAPHTDRETWTGRCRRSWLSLGSACPLVEPIAIRYTQASRLHRTRTSAIGRPTLLPVPTVSLSRPYAVSWRRTCWRELSNEVVVGG